MPYSSLTFKWQTHDPSIGVNSSHFSCYKQNHICYKLPQSPHKRRTPLKITFLVILLYMNPHGTAQINKLNSRNSFCQSLPMNHISMHLHIAILTKFLTTHLTYKIHSFSQRSQMLSFTTFLKHISYHLSAPKSQLC